MVPVIITTTKILLWSSLRPTSTTSRRATFRSSARIGPRQIRFIDVKSFFSWNEEPMPNHQNRMKSGSATGQEGNSGEQNESIHAVAHQSSSDLSSETTTSSSSSDRTVYESNNCQEMGFAATNRRGCSVLGHPMGLPLALYLNNALNQLTDAKQLAYVQTALDGFVSHDDPIVLENLLAATMLDWKSGVITELTKKLGANLDICQIGESLLTVEQDKHIVNPKWYEKGAIDFMFREKKTNDAGTGTNSGSSIVALLNFALEENHWWAQQQRILKHVNMLRTNPDESYTTDQPMLLSVITIETRSNMDNGIDQPIPLPVITMTNNEKCLEANLSDKERFHANLKLCTENQQDIENIPLEVRFAVFLCIPKGTDDFSIALLWRRSTTKVKDASTQFGKILHAIQLCSYLKDFCNVNESTIDYKTLSPDCCKIGNAVFRSYDNRLRPIERRPDLYFMPNICADDPRPMAEPVLEILDVNASLDFGTLLDFKSLFERMDWLWEYEGKLQIISTPYHPGLHYAARPHHFLPIIDQLVHLHSQGLVHGDIRAMNMVLLYDPPRSESDEVVVGVHDNDDSGNDCKGWLIDFDFGGQQGAVSYPKGYTQLLHDGERPGEEGQKITILDDWQSLIALITCTRTHFFRNRKGIVLTDAEMLALIRKKEELQYYWDYQALDNNDPLLSDFEHPANLLRQYIHLTFDKYDVTPGLHLRSDLAKSGLL